MTTASGPELRARAQARVRAREDFQIHLFVYLVVNALLWVLWALTGSHLLDPWPLYVLLAWGIVLGAHWYRTYGPSDGRREAEIEEEIAAELQTRQRRHG